MLKKTTAYILLFAATLLAADDYSQWIYFRNITLNTGASGAKVSGSVTNFPVLIRLSAADSLIFKNSKDSGQDVRFSKSTGTHFPYQIERWDKPNMVAEIWVLVDAIIGSNGAQFIKMYWGNSGAADSSKPIAVFNTSNGYMAVYHVAGNLNDATANAYTGVDTGTINADTTALIGYGRRFDGLHFFSPGDLPDRPRGTISCWFRPGFDFNSSRTFCNGIWGKKNSDTNNATLTLRGSVFNNGEGNPGCILTKMENKTSPTTGASIYLTTNTNSFSAGVWYHVAWTWGNNADSIYLNGTRENSKENVTDGSIGVTGTGNDEIGRSKYDSTGNVPHNPNTSFNPSYFLGSMDEIRLDTVARSSAWVKLCYQNQRLTGGVDSLANPGPILPQPPTGLSYTKTKAYYPVGTAITANTASTTPTGVIIDSFTITPQLPLSGLSLSKLTGTISGTPTSGSGVAAIYTITARNVSGSVTCKDTFTVFILPSITKQPVTVSANVGDNAIFALTDSGSQPHTYQWWRGASVVPGATTPQCTVSSVLTSDDNAIFKCVVRYSPTGDSAWSNPCTLHVTPPPSITTQPISQTVLHGSSASFSIAATGALTYLWIKNNADTLSTATTNTLTISAAQKTDDLSRFRCVVKNSGGSVTSNPCTLRVVSAGFSAHPTTGIDTLTVNFVDSSTGGAPVYKWKFGDGDSLASASPSHFYSGVGKYSVTQIVTVAGIVDSQRIPDCVTINYSKPVVLFFADTFYAVDSLTVHFTDTSKGKITSRKWDFGDSSTSASDTTKVTHTYKAPGSYTVKLFLTGPGGVDSLIRPDYIKVRSKSDYQVFIKANKLSSDSVIISIYNFTTIMTSKNTPFPPYADTLGLWFKRGSIPTKSSDSLLYKYSVIDMQTKAQIPFIDTVRVPRSPPSDSVFYGFNTSAFWTPDPMTTFKASDGDLVFMRDTVRPINKLRISGAYLGVDSFAIYCDSILSLDSLVIDSIGIWYGFKDSINFSDAGHAKWLSLSAAIAGAAQGLYTIKRQASVLNGDTARIYCAVQVVAKNRLRSVTRSASFIAGREHPNNPISLVAKATSPTVIQLNWKDKGTGKIVTGIDSIVIWKGMRPVPLVYDSLPPEFTAFRPTVGDTMAISDGLNEKTRYYYGARIYASGLWSSITESSSATDSTPEIQTADRPKNTIRMTKLSFDMSLNQIIAGWEIDSFDTNQEIGITYSMVSFAADTQHLPIQVVRVTKAADSKVVAIPKLVFDSTYFVSLWLRKKDGKWAYPTSESQRSLKMPSDVSWQIVRYFDKFPDTITAFNGKLKLANDIGDTIPTTDTVKYNQVPEALDKGFVPVSNGFYFALHQASAPFHIGIMYSPDSIPSHYTAADIRIYYEKAGEIYVLKNTVVDTAKHMAWALVSDVSYPLIALIDTIALTVEILSHTGEPVTSGRAIVDTFLIRDNCANSGYFFNYGKGDNSRAVSDLGEVQLTQASVIETIEASFVNQENGVRALFTASDGPHTITKNVSRQVIRDSTSDVVSVPAGKWFPLQTTAQLDSPGVKHALKDLYVQGKWYYNNAVFRLFRWCAYSGNAQDSVKWVEYSDTTEWIFNFDPCRLLWIKTKNDVTLHIGKGITTSLKRDYTILAAAHTWTDVALPYGFDIRIGDLIDSTNAVNGRGHKGDSLYYYYWLADRAKQYRSQLLYLSQFENAGQLVANKTDSLSKNVGGFTVFNPLDTPVTLSIPPIPASMSVFRPAKKTGKKTQQSSGWAVRIVGKTESGTTLSDVYCGYCEGKPQMHFYPAPAFFSDIGMRVCDSLKREYGHALAQGMWDKESGALFPLVFSNSSEKSERIDYTVENLQNLPKSVKAFIVDYATGKCENASQPSAVALSKGQTSYRHLAIGTDEYLKKVQRDMQLFHLSLVAAFPNPFSHALKIRYTLPFAGVSIVRFTIIDLMGRVVWERQIPCAYSMGMQEYIWSGVSTGRRPVVGGIYILRMTALDEGKNEVGSFKKKISYLP